MEPPDQTHVTNRPLKQELVVPRVLMFSSEDLLRRLSSVFSFQLCFHTPLSFSLHVSLMDLFCFNKEFLGLKQAEVFVRTGPDPSAAVPGSDIETKITQERRQSWHFHSIFNKNSPAVFQLQLFM